MKPLLVSAALFAASLALAADDPPAKPDPNEKETMKALMLEDAKRKAAEAAAKSPAAGAAEKPDKDSKLAPAAPPDPVPPSPAPAEKPADKSPTAAAANAQAAAQPASVLPKVEVKKARITVLDMQLQEQEKEIAREKKLSKPTELDKALNDPKVSKSLSILGGESADYRANLAKERVSMLQDESDLLEAIAHAKTKEEKAALQKDLDELRAYRRDLEQSLR
jgi:hypothetical protein